MAILARSTPRNVWRPSQVIQTDPKIDFFSTEKILQIRKEHLLPSVVHYYQKPLHLRRASMQWVWDDAGNKYLDAFGAIVTISAGHNHPRIKDRLKAWMDEDHPQHSTVFYLTSPIAELAEKLTSLSPPYLNRVFFTNSGSEANELALLLAREHTQRQAVIALRHAYHGGTSGTLALCGQSAWKWGRTPQTDVFHAAQPNCYRCPYGATPESCALECAEDVEEIIRTSTCGEIAAFFIEPIQGVGGFIVPPKAYFPRVSEIVKKYGGLFIADEVQTGVGRTGEHWYGILHHTLEPDLITLAKGFGNGASIGAVMSRNEIAESMRGKTHFNTYAGNPWASLQALETLTILEEENTLQKATHLGKIILEGLREFQKSSKIVGEVRGQGLLIGVELVKDKKSKAYGTEETLAVMEETRNRGLLIGKGGFYGNVIRITPPLCITEDDAQSLIKILCESIQTVEKRITH
jgi:alanine-glyoxylate transaminase / (R)-3-amino-2-methylpropionate-pyruvate transaminase